jgi:hypothetical protein
MRRGLGFTAPRFETVAAADQGYGMLARLRIFVSIGGSGAAVKVPKALLAP